VLTVMVIVVLWVRVGWRLVPRVGRRSPGVLNPLAHPPTPVLLKPLVSSGTGGTWRKAD
jgi:hypothetical protein